MARYEDDDAFVLRRVDYGEADVILDVLTEQSGRQSVFARGARKSTRRYVGGLEPFTKLHIRYRPGRDGALGHLQNAEAIEFLGGMVEDPLRLSAGAWLLSLVEGITQPHLGGGAFFHYIWTILRWLASGPSVDALACGMLRAECVLLQDAGVLASLSVCQLSGQPLENLSSAVFYAGEGLVDRRLAVPGQSGHPLERESLDLLAAALDRRVVRGVKGEALHPVREGLFQTWALVLERPPKTWALWDEAIRAALPVSSPR